MSEIFLIAYYQTILSVLVYTGRASAVKMCRFSSSPRISLESLMYEGMRFRSCFSPAMCCI